jgi:hypothetical protein
MTIISLHFFIDLPSMTASLSHTIHFCHIWTLYEWKHVVCVLFVSFLSLNIILARHICVFTCGHRTCYIEFLCMNVPHSTIDGCLFSWFGPWLLLSMYPGVPMHNIFGRYVPCTELLCWLIKNILHFNK